MVRRPAKDSGINVIFEKFVDGRALKIVISKGDLSLTFWGVHNYGIKVQEADMLRDAIDVDLARAAADPMAHNVFFWVMEFYGSRPGGARPGQPAGG